MSTVINPVAYDRTAHDWKPWEFVLVVDQEGNEAFFKIVRNERLGTSRILIWDTDNPLGIGIRATKLELEHLSPPRENRLYVITPYWEIRFQQPTQGGTVLPADIGLCVPLEEIPCSIDIELENPSGNRRLGTAVPETYELEVPFGATQPAINRGVGGPNGGSIPNYLIPLRDDLSRVWDFGAIFGSFPSITIFNRSLVDMGDFVAPNIVTRLQSQGFLCFTGDRYMIEDPSEEELDALLDRDLGYPFRRITIGGVTQATTRA